MYCTNCGTLNNENTTNCTSCGQVLPHHPASVPNYLVQAILVTFCCCVPFGIPAIVFAAQVNAKLQAGDVAGAIESSRKAKLWCWVAFGAGAAIGVMYVAMVMLGALAEM